MKLIVCCLITTLLNLELAHVLEIYRFPKATKTDELRAALADLNCRHFDVKWVDDNHALAVFASADAGAIVIDFSVFIHSLRSAFEPQIGSHSLIKLRPLSAATPQSQRKAKQSAGTLILSFCFFLVFQIVAE